MNKMTYQIQDLLVSQLCTSLFFILCLLFSATVLLHFEDMRFEQTGEFGGVVYLGERRTMDAKFYVSIFYLYKFILGNFLYSTFFRLSLF